MRKNNYLIILIVLATIISSCNSSRKGITNFSSNSTQEVNITKFQNIGTLDIKKSNFKIGNSKSIKDTNNTGEIIQAFLMVNSKNHNIFLPSTKNINIHIDNKNIIFDKDDYVNNFSKEFFDKVTPLMRGRNTTIDVIKKLNNEKTKQIEKLNSIKQNLSDNEYKLLHGIITGKIAHIKFMLSEKLKANDLKSEYYDFVDSVPLNNDQFLKFTDNVNTLNEIIKVRYFREYSKPFEDSDIKVEYINKIIKNRELASAFTCLYMSNLIPDLSKNEKVDIITKMKNLNLKERYINHVSKVKPATSLGKIVGNEAKYIESLVSFNKDFSIEQLKGKIIYVDNWATWCGACLNGIKHFKSKYNQITNNKNVIFLFVSYDRKESIWRKYIESKSFSRKNIIHLYDSKGMNSEYAIYYGIRRLPTSFVIDNNMKVKNINPPVFEDKEFISFINKALN